MGETNQNIIGVVEDAAVAFDAVVFALLALYGVVAWLRSRDAAAAWFAGMFAVIAVAIGIGIVMPDLVEDSFAGRVPIALMGLFPLLLYRFTRRFAPGHFMVDLTALSLTVIVVTWSFFVDVTADDAAMSVSATAFLVVFLGHWFLVSALSAYYFLREARSSVGVSGRRMRMFAVATVALIVGITAAGVTGGGEIDEGANVVGTLLTQLGGFIAAVLFWFALAPPKWLRATWRTRELDGVEGGLFELLEGETVVEVHERTLATAARLTGGDGIILLAIDADEAIAWKGLEQEAADHLVAAHVSARDAVKGRVVATHTDGPMRVMVVDRLIVTCGAAMPFFGSGERSMIGMLSAFATLAEERAATLERERDANERLRQVDQLKTEFVAMVAHDLRTPMAVITGFADTIHDRWDVLDDEHKLEYLQLISRNTRSLGQFVEDVLQVARMESGELHYDMVPFDARAVVSRIVRELQVTHPELKLTVQAPSELPDALGDVDRNWQILNNLVSNALKFSDTPDPRIELQLRTIPEERSVAISVIDRGVGISSEDLPRLFRRFSRVGNARRQVAGTGLGLFIVKSMVEAQGGRIWVQSTPGEGSTFTYTLPIAPAQLAS